MINLLKYKEIINRNVMHIATVNKNGNPNLAVATNVLVLDENKIIISINEMINTQENVQYNKNVALTVFDKKDKGLRLFGTAKFYKSAKYYDLCKKEFFPNGKISPCGATKPKGAMIITILRVEEYK